MTNASVKLLHALRLHPGRKHDAGDAMRLFARLQQQFALQPPLRAVAEHIGPQSATFRILCGTAHAGEQVLLLPGATRIVIDTPPQDMRLEISLPERAGANSPVLLCDAEKPAGMARMFSAHVLWLDEEAPLYPGRFYQVHGPAGASRALVGRLRGIVDDKGAELAARTLKAGMTGRVELELDQPLVHDTIDCLTPLSLLSIEDGRGIAIIDFALRRSANTFREELKVSRHMRAQAKGQRPLVLWFTGLPGSGKSTVAKLLEQRLHEMGKHTYVLDGDNVRHGLCRDLGFTQADRIENMRRVMEVARLMWDAGLIVIVALISPLRREREQARRLITPGEFLEIFVDTPLETCIARDPKGLYAKALAGRLPNFTGIDAPYEPPCAADIHLHGDRQTPQQMVETIITHLQRNALLS